MKLYLHIGWPKTGTTALQSFLHQSRSTLCELGLYYPEGHQGSGDSVPGNGWKICPESVLYKHRHEFLEEIIGAGYEKVILSCEGLSRIGAPEEIRELLEAHFDSISIVVFIRNQVNHLVSYGDEMIKANSRYIDYDWERLPDFATNTLRYAELFAPLGQVIIRVYRPGDGSEVVRQFLSALGVEGGFGEVGDVAIVNRSFDQELIEFKRIANTLDFESAEVYHAVLDRLLYKLSASNGLGSGRRRVFNDSEIEKIRDRFGEVNQKLMDLVAGEDRGKDLFSIEPAFVEGVTMPEVGVKTLAGIVAQEVLQTHRDRKVAEAKMVAMENEVKRLRELVGGLSGRLSYVEKGMLARLDRFIKNLITGRRK